VLLLLCLLLQTVPKVSRSALCPHSSTQLSQPASTTALTAAAAVAPAAAGSVASGYAEGVKIRSLSPHHNPALPACQHYGIWWCACMALGRQRLPGTHCWCWCWCWCCCCCCCFNCCRLCRRHQDAQFPHTTTQPSQPASTTALTAAAGAAAGAAAIVSAAAGYAEGIKMRSLSPHHNPSLPARQHYGTHCCCCCCCWVFCCRLCRRCRDLHSVLTPHSSPTSLPALRHSLLLLLLLLLLLGLLPQAMQKASRSAGFPLTTT
jgi:hypothetical protein